MRSPLGNPGRGGHRASLAADELCFSVRRALTLAFDAESEERVFFCKSATEALNLAIFSVLENRRDRPIVVTTLWEHNAVLRPLYELARKQKIRLRFFDPEHPTLGGRTALKRVLAQGAALLCVFTCRSNVTGRRTDYQAFCKLAKESGAYTVLDASQEAGEARIAFRDSGADYLCFPAHKGLLALPGLGILIASRACPLAPRVFGGTGFAAQERAMPAALPEALEAGTLPVHLIAALGGALEYFASDAARGAREKTKLLAQKLKAGADALGYRVLAQNGGIVLLNHPRGTHSEAFALELSQKGVCVRGGLHCAPLIHRLMGTQNVGAVRFSLGPFLADEEIDETLRVLQKLR